MAACSSAQGRAVLAGVGFGSPAHLEFEATPAAPIVMSIHCQPGEGFLGRGFCEHRFLGRGVRGSGGRVSELNRGLKNSGGKGGKFFLIRNKVLNTVNST